MDIPRAQGTFTNKTRLWANRIYLKNFKKTQVIQFGSLSQWN